jgi:hypothetical protein
MQYRVNLIEIESRMVFTKGYIEGKKDGLVDTELPLDKARSSGVLLHCGVL